METLRIFKFNYFVFLLLFFIAGEMFLLCPNSAKALTISPPVLEIDASSDSVYEGIIKLYNETEKEIVIYTSTSNFTAKEGGEGTPKFLYDEGGNFGLSSWIEIEKGPILFRSGEKKEVSFKINIPKTVDPGGHYAAIFFDRNSPREEGNMMGISGKLGSLILLRIDGDVIENGKIVEFKLEDEKKIYNYLPNEFFFKFENLGTVHLKPLGKLIIKDSFGRIFSETKVNEINSGGNTLPKTIRNYDITRKENIDAGSQSFWGKVKMEKKNFALGKYEARLDLIYGNNREVAQASIAFWVFPWHLMLVYAIAIIILLVFIIFAIKKYNRWIIKKAEKQTIRS